jgi:hypothetical protein
MLWIVPVLEWYHGVLGRLDGSGNFHRGLAARYRLLRTTGLRTTEHVIDRFVERWRPYAARDEARATLTEMLCGAYPLSEPADWCEGAAEPWIAGSLRLIVRDKTVVTVLPLEPL